jgi:hypothetical protein
MVYRNALLPEEIMRKTLFVLATAYVVFCIVWFLPAYGTSPKFYEHRYSATEREKEIIKDVYDHMTVPLGISMWSFLGMYGLFAASMLFERKKKTSNA